MPSELEKVEFEHPDFVAETGKICAAWSLLELITDRILWGVLGVSSKIGSIISSPKDLTARWDLISKNAEHVVAPADLERVKKINKQLVAVTVDRNIAVHGTILVWPEPRKHYAIVTRGIHAGKLNEIDVDRMQVIIKNIKILSVEATKLCTKYKWMNEAPPSDPFNLDWAKPIEGFP